MDPDRWKQVEELYYAALEREASGRAAFLGQACAGDEVPRRRVESLLAHYAQASSGFLEESRPWIRPPRCWLRIKSRWT